MGPIWNNLKSLGKRCKIYKIGVTRSCVSHGWDTWPCLRQCNLRTRDIRSVPVYVLTRATPIIHAIIILGQNTQKLLKRFLDSVIDLRWASNQIELLIITHLIILPYLFILSRCWLDSVMLPPTISNPESTWKHWVFRRGSSHQCCIFCYALWVIKRCIVSEWRPPENQTIWINLDAAYNLLQFRSASGLIAKDDSGKVLISKSSLKKKVASLFAAEACVCSQAVRLGISNGVDSVEIKCDELTVIKNVSPTF